MLYSRSFVLWSANHVKQNLFQLFHVWSSLMDLAYCQLLENLANTERKTKKQKNKKGKLPNLPAATSAATSAAAG